MLIIAVLTLIVEIFIAVLVWSQYRRTRQMVTPEPVVITTHRQETTGLGWAIFWLLIITLLLIAFLSFNVDYKVFYRTGDIVAAS